MSQVYFNQFPVTIDQHIHLIFEQGGEYIIMHAYNLEHAESIKERYNVKDRKSD